LVVESKKRNLIIALMVAMFLGAVEGTVVTTAVPTIVKDLNGFELISWVFSLYLLTSAISTPIYGKLSDLFGRKNTLSAGIVIFLIGSTLCGLSGNMFQLIAFRAVQGIGAGAIFTVSFTIVGDTFSLTERAKVQGWLGSVWGIASLLGPFLGGFLIDNLSWHWIFYINLPFGVLSIVLLQGNLNEVFEKKSHHIDYIGAALLSAAILVLMVGVLSASSNGVWITGVYLAAAAVLLGIFYLVEKRAKEPIFPFEIFTKANTIVNAISFLASAVLIGTSVYMPIYIQNVLGFSATISGLAMAPMSVAWLTSSVVLGKAIPRYGERAITILSTGILILSSILLTTLTPGSPIILVIIYASILGFGFGGSFTTLTIVVQASVDYSKRGAATASNTLVRTLAQTIGVSIFGVVFNLYIVKYFNVLGIKGIDPNSLFATETLNKGVTMEQIKASINSGLHIVFSLLIIASIACTVLSFALSSGLKEGSKDLQTE
jgi:EmrB/QacA subfamily drug resistance transporter